MSHIDALAAEARREIANLTAEIGTPCAHNSPLHHAPQPCNCERDRQDDLAWWKERLANLEA